MAQRLKRLPPMWETRVRSLGWEEPLEKEMVTHSSILAWRLPWTEKPGRLQSMGSQRVRHDWATSHHLHLWSTEVTLWLTAKAKNAGPHPYSTNLTMAANTSFEAVFTAGLLMKRICYNAITHCSWINKYIKHSMIDLLTYHNPVYKLFDFQKWNPS